MTAIVNVYKFKYRISDEMEELLLRHNKNCNYVSLFCSGINFAIFVLPGVGQSNRAGVKRFKRFKCIS